MRGRPQALAPSLLKRRRQGHRILLLPVRARNRHALVPRPRRRRRHQRPRRYPRRRHPSLPPQAARHARRGHRTRRPRSRRFLAASRPRLPRAQHQDVRRRRHAQVLQADQDGELPTSIEPVRLSTDHGGHGPRCVLPRALFEGHAVPRGQDAEDEGEGHGREDGVQSRDRTELLRNEARERAQDLRRQWRRPRRSRPRLMSRSPRRSHRRSGGGGDRGGQGRRRRAAVFAAETTRLRRRASY
mmetsp:Transcript_2527/g.4485  ORF Transcript_2527/g.4485 Transcript_2527/m.4485 type:complete len:243 (+) Transcript_2527:626-1354(+)